MKNLSVIFIILAVILSDVMCAVVAYQYCYIMWDIKHAYAVPASIAFLYAIPFGIGIVICIALAIVFKKKADNL